MDVVINAYMDELEKLEIILHNYSSTENYDEHGNADERMSYFNKEVDKKLDYIISILLEGDIVLSMTQLNKTKELSTKIALHRVDPGNLIIDRFSNFVSAKALEIFHMIELLENFLDFFKEQTAEYSYTSEIKEQLDKKNSHLKKIKNKHEIESPQLYKWYIKTTSERLEELNQSCRLYYVGCQYNAIADLLINKHESLILGKRIETNPSDSEINLILQELTQLYFKEIAEVRIYFKKIFTQINYLQIIKGE